MGFLLNESINSVGYCGLYCSSCGMHRGTIKKAVENMRRVMSTYAFDRIAQEFVDFEPAFQHYTEFEKVLEGFFKILSICPGCLAGGGDPNCPIRDCCKERAYTVCTECFEMDTCEKIRNTTIFQQCMIKALKGALKLKQ